MNAGFFSQAFAVKSGGTVAFSPFLFEGVREIEREKQSCESVGEENPDRNSSSKILRIHMETQPGHGKATRRYFVNVRSEFTAAMHTDVFLSLFALFFALS